MVALRIQIDSREVKDALAALRKEGPRAVADALNRTAFEILDAEEIEVRGAFAFASPNTQRFLARGFRFDKATGDRLIVTIASRPGSRNILERQQFGATVSALEQDVGPAFEGTLAIPQAGVARTGAGKVPVARLPSRLLRRTNGGRAKAYIAGRAVFERIPGSPLGRFLFALSAKARIKPTLDFFGVAVRTARSQFPKKAERVLEKINLRRGR